MSITIIPVRGLPIIHPGDDLAALIAKAAPIEDRDVLCVASTVYSKAKGHVRPLADVRPGDRARRIALRDREDPRFVQAVLDETKEVILEHPFILSVMESGHIGVRAGVDRSNIEGDLVILLPPNPMAAAKDLHDAIMNRTGKKVGIIITDTCGRSFRRGQTGVAIGWYGMPAIRDYRGDKDLFGHVLLITEEAVVDEIAGFSNYVMGESNKGVPAVIFRNLDCWCGHDNLFFRPEEDVIVAALKKCRD
jgi:coenzyme F420-0:L-glutamate ligase/coenzyme F420-1:gamma-L-glutamate ligase